MTEVAQAAGRAGTARGWHDRKMWVAPVAAVCLVMLLGGLGVTSSSLGIYESGFFAGSRPAGLIAGDVRPIRSDEWRFRTPWVLGRSERGLPDELPGGVGAHDLSVTDVPGEPWEALVRPASALYHLFPVRTAFAMEWWGLYAVLFCGIYALLAELTRRPALAAAGGALVVLSPTVQWWTGPNACASFGYSSGAIALFLAASRVRSARLQVALSALSGWAAAAWAAALYPPWQIGAAVVFVPLAVWGLVRRWRDHPAWHEALGALARAVAPAAAVALVLTGTFVLANREAFSIVADTVYPGQRVHESGGGVPLVILLGAPFDYAAQRLNTSLVNGTNQSENASGLALFIPVGFAAYGAAAARSLRRRPSTMPFLCLLASMGVLLTWMLVPVPAWLARVTPLTAAQPGTDAARDDGGRGDVRDAARGSRRAR